MVAKKLGLVVLAVAASLTWTVCRAEDQPPAENQQGRPPAKKKVGRPVVVSKLDDDFFRARLLVVEAVQKDLGLTADQIGKIRDYVKVGWAQQREFLAKAREVSPRNPHITLEQSDARSREFQAWLEDSKRKEKELRTKVLAMLTPSQIERLKQIQLQQSIPAALARPEIVKALEISDEQRGKVRALCDRLEEKLSADRPDLRGLNIKQRRRKAIEFMKAADNSQAEKNNAALDVLTPQQRAKLEKLQGKKIALTWNYDALVPEDADLGPP